LGHQRVHRILVNGLIAPLDDAIDALSNIQIGISDALEASINRLPELSRLRCFLSVAEVLSFRGAADRLNVAQPAISRAVQRLEAEIGFPLLERSTRRVSLTPAGALLAHEANAALDQLARGLAAARQLHAGTAGEIVVAYGNQAASGVMLDLVMAFRGAFPDAQVGLYSLSSDEQWAALRDGSIDLGFLLTAACREGLRHLIVARERFVVLVAAGHPFASKPSVRLRTLADMPFVLGTAKRWGTFRSLVDDACKRAGFDPQIIEEADDAPLLLQLVALGRGVTLYGSGIAPSLPPGIKAVPVSDARAWFEVSVAWDENRRRPLVDAFLALARSPVR
jgi:DNA-binding transcriptional LysR family regulator